MWAKCERPSPKGGTCKTPQIDGSLFCATHTCPAVGCTAGKSSSEEVCPHHAASSSGSGSGGGGDSGGSGGGGGGVGISRKGREGSTYDGFGGDTVDPYGTSVESSRKGVARGQQSVYAGFAPGHEENNPYAQQGLYQKAVHADENSLSFIEQDICYQIITGIPGYGDTTSHPPTAGTKASDRIQELDDAMARHKESYDELFGPWSNEHWIGYLTDEHNDRAAAFTDHPKQPNPWVEQNSKYIPTSKHYLVQIRKVFDDPNPSTSPKYIVEEVCKRVIKAIGGEAVAEFKAGPNKRGRRIFEKVRTLDNHFDCIRDYARCYIVIKKGQFKKMPLILGLLDANPDVKIVRAKNRFDPAYDSSKSHGYRDYQIILETKQGWLVEVQVIPEEMLKLKDSLGHADYTKFRFLREAYARGASKNETALEIEEVFGFGDLSSDDELDL